MFGFGKKKEEGERLGHVLNWNEMNTVRELLKALIHGAEEMGDTEGLNKCREILTLIDENRPFSSNHVETLMEILVRFGTMWKRPELNEIASKIMYNM